MAPPPTLPSLSLISKLAIITGGAGGLGLSIAEGLIRSGASVAIVDLNIEAASTAAKHLNDFAAAEFTNNTSQEPSTLPLATAHKCDVSQPDSVNAALKDVISSHKARPLGVDILITAAGFTENFPAEEYPYDRLKRLWGVNVDGTYLWASAIASDRRARLAALARPIEEEEVGVVATARPGGRLPFEICTNIPGCSIVMIGSMSGAIVNVPQPQAPYNVSKAAVRHMAASMAVEWADVGIRVNCVSPGYMATELTKTILEQKPELGAAWISRIPAGRMGRPEDLQGMVVFLASDASLYVTGAEMRVDGGYTVV